MLLVHILQDKTTKCKMEDKISKKNKSKCCELVNQSILLECPEKEDLKSSKYIDHMLHNTPGNSTSGKYVVIDRCKS